MLLTMWIHTLDGNNTFHGMGMIVAITPATKSNSPILRGKHIPDISMMGRVPILFHTEEGHGTAAPNSRPGPNMEDIHPLCLTMASMVWDDAVYTAG